VSTEQGTTVIQIYTFRHKVVAGKSTAPIANDPCRRARPLLVLVMHIAVIPGIRADEKNSRPDDKVTSTQREESLRQMRVLAGKIEVESGDEKEKVAAELLAEPVVRYSDQPRLILDATLWCFGTKGRPAAFCKIEKYPAENNGNRWLYCFASLSTSLVDAEWDEDRKFSATGPGVAFIELKDTPPPAPAKAARLRQMKDLIRRISVSIADPDQGFKENLRLMVRPVHLYDDSEAGILDGAAFVFSTNGTNPDVIILIEAQETAKKNFRWRVAPARMTTGELSLRDKEVEIWTAPFSPFEPNIGRNLDTWMYFYSKP